MMYTLKPPLSYEQGTMANPDLDITRVGFLVLPTFLWIFPFLFSSIQNKGGLPTRATPLDPPLAKMPNYRKTIFPLNSHNYWARMDWPYWRHSGSMVSGLTPRPGLSGSGSSPARGQCTKHLTQWHTILCHWVKRSAFLLTQMYKWVQQT